MVLTATDSTSYSFEGDDLTGEGTRSLFTRFLVQGLVTGEADADRDGVITLDELYHYAYDEVVSRKPQQRPKKQDDVEGRIVLARNVSWRAPAVQPARIDSTKTSGSQGEPYVVSPLPRPPRRYKDPRNKFTDPRYRYKLAGYRAHVRQSTLATLEHWLSSAAARSPSNSRVHLTPSVTDELGAASLRILGSYGDTEVLALVEWRDTVLIFGIEVLCKADIVSQDGKTWSKSYAQFGQSRVTIYEPFAFEKAEKCVRIGKETIYVEQEEGPTISEMARLLQDLQLLHAPPPASKLR